MASMYQREIARYRATYLWIDVKSYQYSDDNHKSSMASMTPEQAAAIFLGKTQTLPTGQTAVPADLPESSQARDIFYSKAAGKSQSQVKATWARLTFSGKATPPKEVPTAADVKKHVAANPDAIGYIEKSAVDNTVKVVLVVE